MGGKCRKLAAEKAKAEGTKEGHRGGCCLELEIVFRLKQINPKDRRTNSCDTGREPRSSAESGVPKAAAPVGGGAVLEPVPGAAASPARPGAGAPGAAVPAGLRARKSPRRVPGSVSSLREATSACSRCPAPGTGHGRGVIPAAPCHVPQCSCHGFLRSDTWLALPPG